MKHGYVKIGLCSPATRVGAVNYNLSEIEKCITNAEKKKAEIVVFPEMSLTGATLGSMAQYSAVSQAAEKALDALVKFSTNKNPVIVVGLPINTNNGIVSCAAVIFKGELLGLVPKYENSATALGYDHRFLPCGYIFSSKELNANFSVVLGEDFDKLDASSNYAAENGAELIINISCGKALIGSFDSRINKINTASDRLIAGYVYVSAGSREAVAENVFCGDRIASENGKLVDAKEGDSYDDIMYVELDPELARNLKRFGGRPCMSDFAPISEAEEMFLNGLGKNSKADITRDINKLPFVPDNPEFSRIFDIMGRGIYSRMREVNCDSVVIGISGGLDSTIVLLATERMFKKYKLDSKNIIAVTMSGLGSSSRTADNAKKLIKSLNVTHIDIPISDAVKDHLKAIGHDGKKDSVYENAQARERTQILLDLANKYNSLMLGTSDLSEIALGWSTFGGDQVAQYNPNSSLTKTLIRAMMRNYCLTTKNGEAAAIVNDVLNTPISPELIENQKTEDILGPYELHDFFLYNMIGNGFSPSKVVYLAKIAFSDTPEKEILKHLRTFVTRFFKNQFKRRAGCDGIQVTRFDLTEKTIYSEFDDELFLSEIIELENKLNKKNNKKN